MPSDIGQVQSQIFQSDAPFSFVDGSSLPSLTLSYETYGELSPAKDNAILLFHALSGSQHAAGTNPTTPGDSQYWTEECHPGWWDGFIGPGKALDTNRFFVICANYVGGCYGSTGPATTNPETGKPYGSTFPHICTRDVVNSQILLLDHLGIEKLKAVVGPSTGGLACLTFAANHPERTQLVIPVASGVKTTVLNRLFLLEQILSIENDPHFNAGDYYEGNPPSLGLALARMISHKNFVHLDAIERRASKDVRQADDRFSWYRVHDQVESYMLHQGKKFVDRFDANTYIRIAELWSHFDPLIEADADSIRELFTRSKEHGHHYLVFSIDEDYCFYPEEQAHLIRYLKDAGVSNIHITVHSDRGHDSFLLEPELYTPHLSHALNSNS